jgi:hypothetical protein
MFNDGYIMVNNGEYLVGGLETMIFLTSHTVGNVIIPTDDSSYFSEGLVETTSQKMLSILDLGYLNF